MLNALLSKVPKRFQGELALALVRTLFARGVAALGGLLLIVVLGRLYGASGVGVFALAQSLYLGAGIIAKYGMDNALLRYVGQNHLSNHIKVYLRWALVRALYLSITAALAIYGFRGFFANAFNSPVLESVLPGISLAIPAFTLAFILSGFMKGINKPATACLLENGSISLVASFLILGFNSVWLQGGIAHTGWAFALASWLVLGQGAWQAWLWFSRQRWEETKATTKEEFHSSSQAFFLMSLAQFMQQVLGIMVAGWLLSSDELGLFRSAERMAFLISFILLVINAIFPPRFAKLFYQGDYLGLAILARKGALLGSLLASPLLLVCLLFPSWVLGLMGPEFSQASLLLQILAGAQLVNVATGSVGFLLNMTGHERLMRNIALACNALGLALLFSLISLFGALGAALALATVLVLQNLTALVFVWRRLGIWMLPLPNLFKLLGIPTQRECI